jgi:hypothetical protein
MGESEAAASDSFGRSGTGVLPTPHSSIFTGFFLSGRHRRDTSQRKGNKMSGSLANYRPIVHPVLTSMPSSSL